MLLFGLGNIGEKKEVENYKIFERKDIYLYFIRLFIFKSLYSCIIVKCSI